MDAIWAEKGFGNEEQQLGVEHNVAKRERAFHKLVEKVSVHPLRLKPKSCHNRWLPFFPKSVPIDRGSTHATISSMTRV